MQLATQKRMTKEEKNINKQVSPLQVGMSQQEGMVSCKIPSRLFISLEGPSIRQGVKTQGSPCVHCESGKEK